MRFRLAIGFVLLAAALWSGWWFVGSRGQGAAWEAWFTDRRAAGWLAEYETLNVAGFPNRFDTEFTALQLADPRAGWAWSAPWVRLFMLSYKPNHVIAELPPMQKVSFGAETVDVASTRIAASLRVEPDTNLALVRLSAEIEGLELQGRSGWTAAAPAAALHLLAADPELAPENSYDLQISATDVDLPVPLVENLDPTGQLSTRLDTLLIEGRITFDAPLDRRAVEEGRLGLRAFSLSAGRLEWGEMTLSGRGLVEVGADGYPTGEIALIARGWRKLVEVSVAAGMIEPGIADALKVALELVAMVTSGGKREIETTLRFAGGRVFIGPVAIGPAPRLIPPR